MITIDELAKRLQTFVKTWNGDFLKFHHEVQDILVKYLFERTVQHKVRQSTYGVLGELELQLSEPERIIREGDKITVYVSEDGKLYGRFPDEFNDGRFEDM